MHGFVKWVKMKTFYCIATTFAIFLMFYVNNTSYIKKTKLEVFSSVAVSERPTTKDVETTTHVPFYITMPRTRTRYILLWTNPRNYPFVYFGEGNSIFKTKNCKYINCYVTGNREILRNVKDYDIIAFNGPQLITVMTNDDWPKERSVRQKYVYTNIEAATNYPLCSNAWNNYFNWTWTYKLDSDAIWGYVVIKNSSNHVIGPSTHIDWVDIDDMETINKDVKKKLASKSQAAAWFVSNCNTVSKREDYVNRLSIYLNDYNLKVDIYGACGTLLCPKPYMNRCLEEVQRRYYFYFAFENAISEDYVTEKILNALNHYAVPVVFGGANYDRFLPPGSYLNAYKLEPKDLAKEMYDIIENRELYYRFFRWRKYYSYHLKHESPDTDDYCRFCEMANDEVLMANTTIYENFTSWWTPEGICTNIKHF